MTTYKPTNAFLLGLFDGMAASHHAFRSHTFAATYDSPGDLVIKSWTVTGSSIGNALDKAYAENGQTTHYGERIGGDAVVYWTNR